MAKKPTKTKEAFTVKDFKMWLLGLTEFQETGWTPNAKQWKTILEKVEMLDETQHYPVITTSGYAQQVLQPAIHPVVAPPVDFNVDPDSVVPTQENPLQIKPFDNSQPVEAPAPRFLEQQITPKSPNYF